MMPRYAIVHDIYEAAFSSEGPVVRHIFFGRTPEQAERIYQAHRQTDAFLRGCDDAQHFGSIRCMSRLRRVRVR